MIRWTTLRCSIDVLNCLQHAPSPHFAGLPATRVIIEGSTFDVRVKSLQAEALRLNAEYAPRLGPIGVRASKAMETGQWV